MSRDGPLFAARVAMADARHIIQAKRAIRRALDLQVENNATGRMGTSLIEILLGCPTNWKMTPQGANRYVAEEMTKYFPLGVFKEPAPARAKPRKQAEMSLA